MTTDPFAEFKSIDEAAGETVNNNSNNDDEFNTAPEIYYPERVKIPNLIDRLLIVFPYKWEEVDNKFPNPKNPGDTRKIIIANILVCTGEPVDEMMEEIPHLESGMWIMQERLMNALGNAMSKLTVGRLKMAGKAYELNPQVSDKDMSKARQIRDENPGLMKWLKTTDTR